MKTKRKTPANVPAESKQSLHRIRHVQYAYDRILVALDTPTPDLPIKQLQKLCRGETILVRGARPFDALYVSRVELFQPQPEAIRLLNDIVESKGYAARVERVEVACDLISASREDTNALGAWILAHVTVPNMSHSVVTRKRTYYYARATTEAHEARDDATADENNTPKRKARKVERNFVLYFDRRSKLAGPWRKRRCVHIEFRFRGQRTLEGKGLSTLADLAAFDHPAFWRQELKLRRFVSKAKLGRWLDRDNADVSGTALRKRANVFMSDNQIAGRFVMQKALQEDPSLREVLLDVDPSVIFVEQEQD